MTSRVSRLALVGALVLALCGLVAASAAANPEPQTAPGDPLDPRTYAPDSTPYLVVHAIGVQKYACQPDGSWLFTDPEADLYEPGSKKPKGTHFLNFATGRPMWQWQDGSSVEAARKASAPAGAGNIPSLLLEKVAAAGDRLGRTTWVQRLNTAGGVAPVGTCTPGATRGVPYESDYFFWKAGH